MHTRRLTSPALALLALALSACTTAGGGGKTDVKSSDGAVDNADSDGTEGSDKADSTGTDGTDAKDGTDGGDGTDAADGSDGSDGADGTQPQTCETHADCADAAKPACDAATGKCTAPPVGGAIGWGDGTADSALLETVFEPTRDYQATDLDFHPTRDELWVALREFPVKDTCDEATGTQAGCEALEGTVAIITGPTGEKPKVVIMKDLNAWHFMRRPTSLAFTEGDNFATCPEARTGNYTDDAADFIGPSLWTSDPEIFAQEPGPGLNGSHLDMLHQTPYCMGITHIEANSFWAINGQVGALEFYDFADDHGPGHDDHSDGIHHRFVTGELLRLDNVPSHIAYDAEADAVYVADTGNARIVRIETKNAKPGKILSTYEPMVESREYTGAVLTELVAPGGVNTPSGITLDAGVLYVSDYETSKLHAFDTEGKELRSLDTGLPSGTLAGIVIHPATGRLYFVDMHTGTVRRVEPAVP